MLTFWGFWMEYLDFIPLPRLMLRKANIHQIFVALIYSLLCGLLLNVAVHTGIKLVFAPMIGLLYLLPSAILFYMIFVFPLGIIDVDQE